MATVAFLGLGVMGFPMAGHLASAGHDVVVYNRTRSRAEEWTTLHSGRIADTPADAAHDREFVMCCVGNDDDLRSVCCGSDGAFDTLPSGSLFVDHTTVSAKVTHELGEVAHGIGAEYVDAPVSGGQAGAENGHLSIMCGGSEDGFSRAVPVIDAYARICRRIGQLGSGQLAKMVNQICIAGLLQGLAEGLHFAEMNDLDPAAVVEVIKEGAAGSWQMANRHQTMGDGEFDFGFAVNWMRKDLRICLEAGDASGASLPVTALVDQFYAEIQTIGGGRWDTSSLIQRLRHLTT